MTDTNVIARANPLVSGSRVAAIVPTSMEDAYRLATAICKAGMAPKGLDTPEKALIAIMHGMELGMTPMAAMQRIAIIGNRPAIWGDAVIGLVQASGLAEYIKEWTEGEGDKMVAYCETKRKGEPEAKRASFSVDDAKVAGLWGKDIWQKYPKRMLQMRARGFNLRDAYADALGGLYIAEEIQDLPEAESVKRAPPPDAAPAIEHKPAIVMTEVYNDSVRIEGKEVFRGDTGTAGGPIPPLTQSGRAPAPAEDKAVTNANNFNFGAHLVEAMAVFGKATTVDQCDAALSKYCLNMHGVLTPAQGMSIKKMAMVREQEIEDAAAS